MRLQTQESTADATALANAATVRAAETRVPVAGSLADIALPPSPRVAS